MLTGGQGDDPRIDSARARRLHRGSVRMSHRRGSDSSGASALASSYSRVDIDTWYLRGVFTGALQFWFTEFWERIAMAQASSSSIKLAATERWQQALD